MDDEPASWWSRTFPDDEDEYGGVERPVSRHDLTELRRELWEAKREVDRLINQRIIWSHYNRRMAEAAFSFGSSAYVVAMASVPLWMGRFFDYTPLWTGVAAIAMGGWALHSVRAREPKKPED